MASFGLGAGLNGLANGINNAMELRIRKDYYDGLNSARDERNRILEEKAAADAAAKGNKGVSFDEFDKNVLPIFGGGNKPFADKLKPVQMGPGLGGPGQRAMIPEDVFSGNAPAGSLASTQRQGQADPDADLPPRQRIVKEMLFGNLANDPDRLNAINTAAVMSGVGDKVTPWLEGLYKAKKRGVFDGAMNLLNNNVDGAIDDLKRGGITLEDRPVKVNPDDPNDHRWKINISGTGERVMDIKNMIGSTMDADKFLDWQNKTNESIGKRNVSDAQVKNLNASADKNTAMAKAYGNGGLGAGRRAGSAGALGPTVRKTLETDQGIVAVMSDGTKRILTDDNGKPMFGTSGQKIAAGLVGKTLNQYGDNGDIAGKVNSLAGQLQGVRPQAQARINTLPEGAKQIGTSNGKPVYEVNGKRFIAE